MCMYKNGTKSEKIWQPVSLKTEQEQEQEQV